MGCQLYWASIMEGGSCGSDPARGQKEAKLNFYLCALWLTGGWEETNRVSMGAVCSAVQLECGV